uniref:Uncharacterized protein n=1 Tax=Tanacetum cinerariifolium TaxID=118510 RepID=A0A6L2LWK0_TANCI|nr:hypothetical protein [Tanacetum cinerariifolium]
MYVSGRIDIFDMIDIDLFTVVTLNMMVLKLGYTGKSEPMFYNYLRPFTSLDEGLYALACKEDVRCLSSLVRSFKLIEANFPFTTLIIVATPNPTHNYHQPPTPPSMPPSITNHSVLGMTMVGTTMLGGGGECCWGIKIIGGLVMEVVAALVGCDGGRGWSFAAKIGGDGEDEVALVGNEMADFMASKEVGYGTNCLVEQWKETFENNNYNLDPYDYDMYECHDMSDKIQAICDNLDIKVRCCKKKYLLMFFVV